MKITITTPEIPNMTPENIIDEVRLIVFEDVVLHRINVEDQDSYWENFKVEVE